MHKAWITVKTFDSLVEAVAARSALRSEGILSFIPEENQFHTSGEGISIGTGRFFSGRVELQVKPGDLDNARRLLELD